MFLSLMSLWGINPQRRRVTMEREELEKRVEEAKKELIRLNPLCREATQKLKEVSDEITFWADTKYQAEMKLVKVEKVAPKEQVAKRSVKVKKEPTFAEILASFDSISSFDREKLAEALKI